MSNIDSLIGIAKKEIGYKEGVNNATKYGAAFGMDHVSWCSIFVWWCFKQAGLDAKIIKTAGCETLEAWAVSHKMTVPVASAKPGDLLLYDFTKSGRAEHIEIATSAVDKGMIHAIGGNTSDPASGSQSNGDGVYAKTRPIGLIKTVVRPQY
jgi:cell wall-associated NlpC family hydrolase